MFAITVIAIYGIMQYMRLIKHQEPDIMVSVMDSHFESDHTFKDTDGLMLAFAITAFDENQESIEDPQYGRLKAYYKTWGLDDSAGVTFTEIPSSYCTRAELGLPEIEGDTESDYSKAPLFFE